MEDWQNFSMKDNLPPELLNAWEDHERHREVHDMATGYTAGGMRLMRIVVTDKDKKNIRDVNSRIVYDSGEFFWDRSDAEAMLARNIQASIDTHNADVRAKTFDLNILREHGRSEPLEPVTLDDLKLSIVLIAEL
jgi:hypothetical protein